MNAVWWDVIGSAAMIVVGIWMYRQASGKDTGIAQDAEQIWWSVVAVGAFVLLLLAMASHSKLDM